LRRVEAQSPEFLSAQANDINAGVVGTLDTVGFALAVILIFIALAGAFNTQLLTVRERRGELATLKAVGMTPRQLVAMVCATGTVIGLIGGLVALPVGLRFLLSIREWSLIRGSGSACHWAAAPVPLDIRQSQQRTAWHHRGPHAEQEPPLRHEVVAIRVGCRDLGAGALAFSRWLTATGGCAGKRTTSRARRLPGGRIERGVRLGSTTTASSARRSSWTRCSLRTTQSS
jgi:hypothetical protein